MAADRDRFVVTVHKGTYGTDFHYQECTRRRIAAGIPRGVPAFKGCKSIDINKLIRSWSVGH